MILLLFYYFNIQNKTNTLRAYARISILVYLKIDNYDKGRIIKTINYMRFASMITLYINLYSNSRVP